MQVDPRNVLADDYMWLAIIHAVTRRSCAGHVSIGASRGGSIVALASTCGRRYL